MTMSTVTVSLQKTPYGGTDDPALSVLENASNDLASVQGLMHAMLSSQVLSAVSREKLEEISLGYVSLTNPTPRQQSILLHQLIYDVIYPSMKEDLEDDEIDALFDFEDHAKTRLKQILPEGTDIQNYLKQLSIEKVVIKHLVLYRNFYQSQLNVLNQSAESVNSKMIAKFEEIRDRFLKFSAQTEILDKNLKKRIEEVAKKMDCLGNHYEKVRDKAQSAARNFNGLQNTIKENFRTFT